MGPPKVPRMATDGVHSAPVLRAFGAHSRAFACIRAFSRSWEVQKVVVLEPKRRAFTAPAPTHYNIKRREGGGGEGGLE